MYLGLSIEHSVINAATLSDGGDFVWQDSHSVHRDRISNLLEICGAIVAKAAKAHPNLSQSIAVSAQGGFIGQPSPPDGLKCLAGVDLKANLQASLGRAVALVSPDKLSLFMKAVLARQKVATLPALSISIIMFLAA